MPVIAHTRSHPVRFHTCYLPHVLCAQRRPSVPTIICWPDNKGSSTTQGNSFGSDERHHITRHQWQNLQRQHRRRGFIHGEIRLFGLAYTSYLTYHTHPTSWRTSASIAVNNMKWRFAQKKSAPTTPLEAHAVEGAVHARARRSVAALAQHT